MGSILSNGVGSGLDVSGIVKKLVEAEGKPQSTRLDTQEAKAQAKLSALGSLRSALASFRDALKTLKDLDSFRGRDVTLSDEEFLEATASSSASRGNYAVEVAIARERAPARIADVPGRRERGGRHGHADDRARRERVHRDVTSGNDTLAAIADAINESAQNVGVFATVVTGTGGARLVLASTRDGRGQQDRRHAERRRRRPSGPRLRPAPGSGVTNLTQLEPAADARVLIDGFAVTSATNTIDGAVEGVTLDLLAVNEPGETTQVDVAYEPEERA